MVANPDRLQIAAFSPRSHRLTVPQVMAEIKKLAPELTDTQLVAIRILLEQL